MGYVRANSICGLPRWHGGKESVRQLGDMGSIPRLGRFPGEGNGNPLQYSCLAHPMDRGAWRATVHGVTKESDPTMRACTRLECTCMALGLPVSVDWVDGGSRKHPLLET